MAEWKNVTTSIMIIVLCLNASLILLDSTGVSVILGVETNLSQTPFSQFAVDAQSVETTPNNLSWGEVATIKLTNTLSGFWNLGFALPKILLSMNIPLVFVTFISAPIYACFILSLIYYITGRAT